MKDYYVFLAVMSVTLLVILGLAWADPVKDATGGVHPEFKTMQHSINSQASSPAVRHLGFAFGFCVIAIFGMSLYWGSKRAQNNGFKQRDLLMGISLYAVMYIAMVLSSWEYDQVEAPLWGSVPTATAWMLYGIWLSPIFFVILYVYGFKKNVLSDEDEKAFQHIVKERQARNQSS